MQVVLKQDVKDLGKKGQLVNVSDGYGKNYLIPRKIAVIADATALNELKNREAAKAHRLAVEKANAEAAAAAINGKTVKITAIAEKLKSDFGVDIDKKKIVLDDIRNFGTYESTVKVYNGITAQIYINVGE